MSDVLTVRLDDAQLWEYAQNFPRALRNATRSAIRTTSTFAYKKSNQAVKSEYDLPNATFKNNAINKNESKTYRSRKKYIELSDRTTVRGRIWMGSNQLPAKESTDNSFLGKLRQTQAGAYAGKTFYTGGFIPQLRSGHRAVFLRVRKGTKIGKRGRPIAKWVLEEQAKSLDAVPAMMLDVSNDVQTELSNRFDAKIRQYMLNGTIPSEGE